MSIKIITDFAPPAGANIPVADAIYIKGGYYEVADTTARNAIALIYRKVGMIVRTVSDGRFYRLDGGVGDANWTLDNNVSYNHTQGVASSSWIINHNLGYNPSVLTIDSSGVNIIGSISHPTGNYVSLVNFNRAITGSGFCN